MSKVNAYRCDHCSQIKDIEEMSGILPVEDLFDSLESFPHVPGVPSKMDKTNIHYCLECYRLNVIVPATSNTNRKKDEQAYKDALRNFAYVFRKNVVSISRNKSRKQ